MADPTWAGDSGDRAVKVPKASALVAGGSAARSSGAVEEGTPLPNETELMRIYDVSRPRSAGRCASSKAKDLIAVVRAGGGAHVRRPSAALAAHYAASSSRPRARP